MKPNQKHLIGLIALVMMFAFLFTSSACANRSAYALDYSVEDELYSDQTATPEPESSTTPESDMSATAEPDGEAQPTEEPTPTLTDPVDILPESTPLTDGDEPTPSPESTADPEATAILEQARYTVCVRNAVGEAMQNVRVKLFMDSGFLYSALTDADGMVFWLLPIGHTFNADAEMSGYRESENSSTLSNLSSDVIVSITLTSQGTESVEAAEPTPTPLPIPTLIAGIVTFTTVDAEIMVGDVAFTLLDYVSAQTSGGESILFWVVDDGGFSADIPGEYRVTYGAMQEGELVTATRMVAVIGESDEEVDALSQPAGSSAERYEILLSYRNEIYDSLTAKIGELSKQYEDKVNALVTDGTGTRILTQVSAENDTDVADDESAEFLQVQEAKVKNWSDVLATFIAQSSLDIDHPLDLMKLRSISLDQLDEVFWQMNPVEVIRIDGVTNIILNSKSYEDMADEYNMEKPRRDFLYELMQPEFQRTFASLTGNIAFIDAQTADIDRIRAALPEDLEIERKEVVETAFSLVGKVSYLWGGKYNRLGWNERWGLPCSVTTERNGESVVVEKTSGLDCSGFVSWVYINATGDTGVIDVVGNGSSNQWAHSTAVGWDQGEPGDLVFYNVPGEKEFNHVGIIVSVDDDGSYLVAHCSARKNGVVVTEAWSTGFRYIRRPILFES